LRIQIGQRLVHQAYGCFGNDCASQCDALLLSAGELAGAAFEQVRQSEDIGHAL
jgi:hypothetical protein